MSRDPSKIQWWVFPPSVMVDVQLPHPIIQGPIVTNMGYDGIDECPWPWEPQQLVGAPLGQYHCPYCGAMVVAGVEHPDYDGIDHRLLGYQ